MNRIKYFLCCDRVPMYMNRTILYTSLFHLRPFNLGLASGFKKAQDRTTWRAHGNGYVTDKPRMMMKGRNTHTLKKNKK